MRNILILIVLMISMTITAQENNCKMINKGNGKVAIVHNGELFNYILEDMVIDIMAADSIKIEDFSAQLVDLQKEIEDTKKRYFMIGLSKGVEFQYSWTIQGNLGKVINSKDKSVDSTVSKYVVEEGNKLFDYFFHNKK